MKKLTVSILCLLTALFAVVGITGCKKNNATTQCTHETTVLKSGTEYHWYECSCGYKTGEKQTHVLGSDAVVVEPTFDTDGYKSGKCTVCGTAYVEVLPATRHEHEMVHTEKVEATCEKDGTLEYWTCTVCEGIFKDELGDEKYDNAQALVIPAINHANERLESKKNPTCGVDGEEVYYCPDCQRERVVTLDALTHNYKVIETVTATCQHGGYELEKCENCRDERHVNETPRVGHKETYQQIVEPTCSSLGKGVYTCEWCQATREEEIGKHDHSYVNDGAGTVVAPTCTEDGYTLHDCDNCDYTYKDNIVPNLGGHKMEVDTTASLKATCEDDGLEVKKCSNKDCGYTESTVIEALGHDMVHATCTTTGYCKNGCDKVEAVLGHSYVKIDTVTATCLERGYDIEKCSVCGDVIHTNKTDLADCNEVYAIVTEATCTEKGKATYTCSVCNTVREVEVSALGHSYEKEGAVTVVEVTCTADGYTLHKCDNCDYSYKDNIVTSNGHVWELSPEDCVEATCTSNGLKVEKCSCGAIQREEIISEGHDIVSATCTEDGYCTKCDDYNEPKKGHDLTKVLEEKQPTHTEDGFVKYGCAHEGCQETDVKVPQGYEKKGHDGLENKNEIIKVEGKHCTYKVRYWYECSCGETIESFGDEYEHHDYVGKITTEPTCVAGGVMTYTCKECNDESKAYTENINSNPIAHKLDNGTTENGVITYRCTNGGCEYSETQVVVSEEGISSDAIKGSDKVSVGDTTISLDEATKGQLGDNANVQLSAGTLDETKRQEAINNLTDEQKALLGDNSEIYNFEMSVNGESVSNFEGKVTVRIPYNLSENEDPNNITVWYLNGDTPELVKEVTYVVIDGQGYAEFSTSHFSYYTVAKMTPKEICAKYGHNYGAPRTFPATCMSGGYDMEVCKRCGYKNVYNETNALGHDYQEVLSVHVDVTCTVDGYAKFECTRCQVSYEEKTAKLGHDWYKAEDRCVAPTCTQAGKNVFECNNCDDEYEVAVKKLDHVWVLNQEASANATCTELGTIVKSCANGCGAEIISYIPALGHKIKDTVVKPTCSTKGYTAHSCTVCQEKFADTDFTDMVDHEWDREAPDCEHDKLCKHCKKRDENNGKAHGHFFEDGKCKHCAKPCNHTFKYSHTVESTCTGAGYDVEVCKHCGQSKYVYLEGEGGTGHSFQVTDRVDATCQTVGYIVETCTACGFKQTTETGEVSDHVYEDGKCIYCKTPIDVSKEYIDFIESFLATRGFALSVEDLEFYLYELDFKTEEYELIGSSSLVEMFELMIYLDENGELQGAGNGKISIFNGPVEGYNATFGFKAIISGGFLYVEVEYDMGATETIQVKMNVEDLLQLAKDSIEEEAFDGMEVEQLLQMVEMSGALDVLEAFSVLFNEEDVNKFATNIVKMLFAEEKTDDGYVYKLDFDKVKTLSDVLAQYAVADVIDIYFGEGAFDTLATTVLDIAGLELAEIPSYIASLGVDVDVAASAINNLCITMMGAPEGFDILAALENPEMQGYELVELISEGEMTSSDLASMADMLRRQTVYVLAGATEEDVAMVGGMVEQIVTMLDGFVGITVKTDLKGIITSINVWADQFNVQVDENDYFTLSISVTLAPNGRIEITWAEIEEEINGAIDLPEMEDETYEFDCNQEQDYGYVEIDGRKHHYNSMIISSGKETYKLSDLTGVAVYDDCGDWKYYELLYLVEREVIGFELLEVDYNVEIMDGYWTSITRYYIRSLATGEMYEVRMQDSTEDPENPEYSGSETYYPNDKESTYYPEEDRQSATSEYQESTYYPEEDRESVGTSVEYAPIVSDSVERPYTSVYKYSSGSIIIIGKDGTEISLSQEEMMNVKETYVKIFGQEEWLQNSYVESDNVYYNAVTNEFKGSSQHNYVKDEERSYAPTGCEDIGKTYYVCTECNGEYFYSYTNGHNYENKYVLSEGSLTCDDGYDMYYECVDCGEVGSYYENWGKGHNYTSSYEFDGETVSYNSKCRCCGKTNDGYDMFDIYTDEELEVYEGRWGKPVEVKPGMGGNVSRPVESVDGIKFVFTASQSGKYEFYSKNIGYFISRIDVYNVDFERLNYYSYDNFERENFGMTFDLVAGETYYIVVEDPRYGKEGYGKLYFNKVATEEVDLSAYGCTCDGKIYIETLYGRKNATVKCECGINYNQEERYETENCQEVIVSVIVFYTENGESQEYLVDRYYTGYYKHESEWKDDKYDEEKVDENGNVIGYVRGYFNGEYCPICGKWLEKRGGTYEYDVNGNLVYESDFREYWSDELGETYVERKYERAYTYVTYTGEDGDRKVQKTAWTKEIRYDEWYLWEYTYTDNSCQVTEKFTTSYGEEEISTYFNHQERTKWIEEGSDQVGELVEINGFTGKKYVNIYETYCEACYGSLSQRKEIIVYYVDENGNEHQGRELLRETIYYDLVAENAETSYWVERQRNSYEYGWFTPNGADWYDYVLACNEYRYENGEVNYSYNARYEYPNGNFCEYVEYETYYHGGEETQSYTNEGTNHKTHDELRLHEGANSCTDGLDLWYVCGACDYEYLEEYNEYWSHGHDWVEGNREVILLSEFGAVCGGYLEVYTCPCGERSEVHVQDACSLDWEETCEGDLLTGYHYTQVYHCAVTDPLCDFEYVHEYWYVYDEECHADRYDRWTFTKVDGTKVVYESKIEKYWSHNHTTSWFDETSEVQEGEYIVRISKSGKKCDRCGFITRLNTQKDYYKVVDVTNEDGSTSQERVWDKGLYVEESFTGCNLCGYCYYRSETEEIALYNSNDQTWWVRVPSYTRETRVERWTNEKEGANYEEYVYWYETRYSYDGRCVNEPIVTYTYSDMEGHTEEKEHDWNDDRYGFYSVEWNPSNTCTTDGYRVTTCRWCGESCGEVVPAHGHGWGTWAEYELEPTCTQWGMRAVRCEYCNEYLRSEKAQPYTHAYDYYLGYDPEFGYDIYECSRCGLQGKGYDGNVVLEDLGIVDGNFKVGYWVREYFDYMPSVSLINSSFNFEWGNEYIAEIEVYGDGKYFYISVDAITALCEELGVAFDQTMVRLNVLPTEDGYYDPINGQYDFVYAITIDSHCNIEEPIKYGVPVNDYQWDEMANFDFENYRVSERCYNQNTGEDNYVHYLIADNRVVSMACNSNWELYSIVEEESERAQIIKDVRRTIFFNLLGNGYSYDLYSIENTYWYYGCGFNFTVYNGEVDLFVYVEEAEIWWDSTGKVYDIRCNMTIESNDENGEIIYGFYNYEWSFSSYNQTNIDEILEDYVGNGNDDGNEEEDGNVGDNEGGAGDGATVSGVYVDEETWYSMLADGAFANYTLTQSGYVEMVGSDYGYQQDATVKFTNDYVYFVPMINGEVMGEMLYEGDEAYIQRWQYEVIFRALLENYSGFVYNETTGIYENGGTVSVEYEMYGAIMRADLTNAKMVWNSNGELVAIAGEYTQTTIQNGETVVLTSNITWTFSDFGTTVINVTENGEENESGEIIEVPSISGGSNDNAWSPEY